MLFSILIIMISGFQNSRKRNGWSYTLFIIGMALFFHIGSNIIPDDLSSNGTTIAMLLGFIICACIYGFTTYIFNNEKSRTIDDRN
jgi:hypothetical protein